LRYTIESRELTSEYTHRPTYDGHPRRIVIEADDADQAISQYVSASDSELVSFIRPKMGEESIATVKKEDTVFLLRVYTD
jgi:hypothetical protein